MPQSTGVVRRIIERDGRFMVSFPNHAGYFKIASGENHEALIARIRAAADSGATNSSSDSRRQARPDRRRSPWTPERHTTPAGATKSASTVCSFAVPPPRPEEDAQ